jgi:DNA invertase Pin-like site-specific DNA recombinase
MLAVPNSNDLIEEAKSRPRVVGLVRVSTAEQAAEGRGGIPRQEAAISNIVARENLECIEIVHVIDVSGTDVLRDPQIGRLLDLVETEQIAGVVCDALDRLVRPARFEDFAILQPFQTHGGKIWTSTQTLDPGSLNGILSSGIQAVLAANELATIRARVDGAKEAKRRQGKCPSNSLTLPLGVSVNPNTREFCYNDKILLVREVFRLFSEEGVRNYSEISRRTGIGSVTVRNLLTNPIYTGWRVYSQKRGKKSVSRNGKTYRQKESRSDGEIIRVQVLEPIVSEEDFARVQRLIAQTRYNHAERRNAGEHTHLGTGIVRCAQCDSPFYCTSTRSRGKRRGYYICARNYYSNRPKSGGCPQRNLREADVDRAVYEFALYTLSDPERLTHILETTLRRVQNTVRPFPAVLDPDAEIAKLRKQEKRLLDAYMDDVINVDELRDRKKEMAARISQLQAASRPKARAPEAGIGDLVGRVMSGVAALPQVSDSRKRKEIVLALFSELRIKDGAIVAFRLHEDYALASVTGGNVDVPLNHPFQICATPEILPEGQKRCSECNTIQPSTSFYRRKAQCRTCLAARNHQRYLRRKMHSSSK